MTIQVKICGLSDDVAVEAAVAAGAAYVGFVFFEKSPRNVAPEHAAKLAALVLGDVTKVGLFVDPDNDTLQRVLNHVALDMIQLHGDELPQRVTEIRERFELPVMKAVPIENPGDVVAARAYENVADHLLFDARAPAGAERPGGNARAFDWSLIAAETWELPWMLAGGLSAENVAAAIGISGAKAVDVSSGVEDAPGRKNPSKIKAFIAAAKGA